jgi:hypothetical protein
MAKVRAQITAHIWPRDGRRPVWTQIPFGFSRLIDFGQRVQIFRAGAGEGFPEAGRERGQRSLKLDGHFQRSGRGGGISGFSVRGLAAPR